LTNVNLTIPQGYLNVKNLVVTQQPSSQAWNLTTDGSTIYLIQTGQGLATGQSLVFTFDATNPQVAGTYQWATIGEGADASTLNVTVDFALVIASILPALVF
jgi:hypothetical protein